MVKKYAYIGSLLVIMFFASCATLFDPGPDKVYVSSHPDNARVFVDGVPVGRTPTVVNLDRDGKGIIEVKKQGYQTIRVDRDKSANSWFLLGLIPPGWGALFDLIANNQGEYAEDPLNVDLVSQGQQFAEAQHTTSRKPSAIINPNDTLAPIVSKYMPKPVSSKNWLLTVGIENYDNVDRVEFSHQSSLLFSKTAQKVFGISKKNTYTLVGDKATAGAIKDTLAFLLNRVKRGDTIYFYYSGHGIPDPKTGEAYILPKDKYVEFIQKDKEFKLEKIYQQLSRSRASRVIAFIDSCFSGKTDNKLVFKGIAPGLLKSKTVDVKSKKLVVLTAGKNNQFSNSYGEKGHRMFTYYLIRSLLSKKNKTIEKLYYDTFANVRVKSQEKGDVYLQEPQIYGNRRIRLVR